MQARAQARYVRMPAAKVRRVVDLIRGMPAAEAQAVLRFSPHAASEPVGKVLGSAMANAEQNHSMGVGGLRVTEAYVDEGPTMRRFRARAQGRGYRIRKRTSHITIVVGEQLSGGSMGRAGRRTASAAAPASPSRAAATQQPATTVTAASGGSESAQGPAPTAAKKVAKKAPSAAKAPTPAKAASAAKAATKPAKKAATTTKQATTAATSGSEKKPAGKAAKKATPTASAASESAASDEA